MATQAKEIIAEISKEFKSMETDVNHLEHEFYKLLNNIEQVMGDYAVIEAEMGSGKTWKEIGQEGSE